MKIIWKIESYAFRGTFRITWGNWKLFFLNTLCRKSTILGLEACLCGQKSYTSRLFLSSVTVTLELNLNQKNQLEFLFFRLANAIRYCNWMPWFSVFFHLHVIYFVLQLKYTGRVDVLFPYHTVVFGFCGCRGSDVTVVGNASYWILLKLFSFCKISGGILNITLLKCMSRVAFIQTAGAATGLWHNRPALVV